MNEWMNECMHERMNERTNERTNEWMNEWMHVGGLTTIRGWVQVARMQEGMTSLSKTLQLQFGALAVTKDMDTA